MPACLGYVFRVVPTACYKSVGVSIAWVKGGACLVYATSGACNWFFIVLVYLRNTTFRFVLVVFFLGCFVVRSFFCFDCWPLAAVLLFPRRETISIATLLRSGSFTPSRWTTNSWCITTRGRSCTRRRVS